MKRIIVAVSLAALLVSGCAELSESLQAATGAATQKAEPGTYPQRTDRGLF
jgi:outer membrane murein-binding lipoprotein Lpp